MGKYTLLDGKVVTDEDLDRIALEFEHGTWSGELTDYHVGPGRPSLTDGETSIISFRAPANIVEWFDRKALEHGETRSQALRTAMEMYLEA